MSFPNERVRASFDTDESTGSVGGKPKKEVQAAADHIKPRTISEVSEEIRRAGVSDPERFEPV